MFNGIEEVGPRESENCEGRIIQEVLVGAGVIKEKDINGNLFDRAHRIGPKKAGQQRPRPIIARFVHYKDKEDILARGYNLKSSQYGMAQDFSKPTLELRSQLVNKAKIVMDKHSYIKGFKLNYKRLILKYENPETKSVYFRGFSLQDTQHPNWYAPTQRN